MKKISILFLALFVLGCATVPVTGRRQLSLVPNSQLLALAAQSYDQVLDESKIIKNTEEAEMVQRVGVNIKNAVQQYMAQNNLSDQLDGFNWEFNLIKEETVNAWCMPGGKVAFYTGIMPICKNDAGVAVVMGHEVAHAIANHGGERMSQGLVQQLGGVALTVALQEQPQLTQQLALSAFGLGSTVGYILPHSRLQESEADEIGLIFMAMAGYDPHEAPEFWKRMQAQEKGARPPEFLSTHPAPETRINALERLVPKAMKYYKP